MQAEGRRRAEKAQVLGGTIKVDGGGVDPKTLAIGTQLYVARPGASDLELGGHGLVVPRSVARWLRARAWAHAVVNASATGSFLFPIAYAIACMAVFILPEIWSRVAERL